MSTYELKAFTTDREPFSATMVTVGPELPSTFVMYRGLVHTVVIVDNKARIVYAGMAH